MCQTVSSVLGKIEMMRARRGPLSEEGKRRYVIGMRKSFDMQRLASSRWRKLRSPGDEARMDEYSQCAILIPIERDDLMSEEGEEGSMRNDLRTRHTSCGRRAMQTTTVNDQDR